ncbi:hypothetical protein ACE414_11175 [Alteromonas macleodii]|uniref:hypothetical protein n=1 Tax=Alteromonas macleodii TaxID=28108 RepID=UPI0036514FC9
MKITNHAELRLAQRSFYEEELKILAAIGVVVEQKGGTSLSIVPKAEKAKWIGTIKEALSMLCGLTNIPLQEKKRVRKVLARTIERLSAKNQPYFVSYDEEDTVITCGHYTARRLTRNH